MSTSWPSRRIASESASATAGSSSTISTRPGRAAGGAAAADVAGAGGAVSTGSSMTNLVPRPGSLSTSIVP